MKTRQKRRSTSNDISENAFFEDAFVNSVIISVLLYESSSFSTIAWDIIECGEFYAASVMFGFCGISLLLKKIFPERDH